MEMEELLSRVCVMAVSSKELFDLKANYFNANAFCYIKVKF